MPNAQCPILNARCGTGQGYDHVKLYDGASSWSGSAYDWEDFGKDPASVAAMPRLLAESGRMGDGKRALPSVVSEAGSALLVFHSDGGAERPGGFLLRWTLQQLQPPVVPECLCQRRNDRVVGRAEDDSLHHTDNECTSCVK